MIEFAIFLLYYLKRMLNYIKYIIWNLLTQVYSCKYSYLMSAFEITCVKSGVE